MILQSLAEFSRRERLVQDPAFEYAGVSWAIEIGPDGEFWDIHDLRLEAPGKKKKLLPRQMLVPKRSKRTVQDQQEFLVDKAEYVLGMGDADQTRRDLRQGLFTSAIARAADVTGLPEAKAAARFLASEESLNRCRDGIQKHGFVSNDLFCFRIDGVFLHDLQELKDFWRRSLAGLGSKVEDQCLLCGQSAPATRLHPNIKGLNGASTSGVPIVSFNKSAFWSYGWENNQNAPVCEECAAAYTTALNRCLSSRFPDPSDPETVLTRQAQTLSENLTAVYWSDDSKSGIEKLASTAITDPQQAQVILSAPYKSSVTSRPLRFHCLLLQGAQGRATIRSYISEFIPQIHQNVRQWFAETEVGTDQPLNLMQVQSSVAIQRKAQKLPPNLAGAFYLSILFGRQLPMQAAQLAVVRNRAERSVAPGRAAILQAWLARKSPVLERKLFVSLNPDSSSTGYQLGRLLAVCEQVQYKNKGSGANKTIADRFFPALSTRPRFVFGPLLRLAELHLSQLRRRGESQFLKGRIGEIAARLSPAELPAHLTLDEQANFALGYYHQRQANFKGKQPALAAEPPDRTADEDGVPDGKEIE